MVYNPFTKKWESVCIKSAEPAAFELTAMDEPLKFSQGAVTTTVAKAPQLGKARTAALKPVPEKKDSPTSSIASKKTAASRKA